MRSGALARHIANLGYGTRREVTGLLATGRITTAAGRVLAASDDFDHDDVRVDGEPLDPPPGAVLMLNKPVGYVCSTRDVNPVVYELLPPRFAHRTPIMAPIGRLDIDSSGLLLLTDDGAFNHLITAPRSHLPKVYEVTLADPLRGDEAGIFGSGTLLLRGDDTPLAPAILEPIDVHRARVTISEGRYHQVRRMFAAVGNHVETLHRSEIGSLSLGDLASGCWRVLTPQEVAMLRADVAVLRAGTRSRS